MKKIRKVLLVDDDSTTNFLHEMLFEDLELCDSIDVALNGKEALDKITAYNEDELPDLILLDVNMPFMNGFEFLEEYEKSNINNKSGIVVLMLTTSLKSNDEKLARSFSVLTDFMRKPLDEEKLKTLLNRFFKED